MREDLLTIQQHHQHQIVSQLNNHTNTNNTNTNNTNTNANSNVSNLLGEVRIKLNIHTKYRYLPTQNGLLTNAGNIDLLDTLNKNLADATSLHEVKNIWMCLNYEKRPTVSHVIDYIRKYYSCVSKLNTTGVNNLDEVNGIESALLLNESNLLNLKSSSSSSKIASSRLLHDNSTSFSLGGLSPVNDHVKLYLDDYFLPPYENSRLIRENDCVRVDILRCINDEQQFLKTKEQLLESLARATKQGVKQHDSKQSGRQQQKITVKEAFVPEAKELIAHSKSTQSLQVNEKSSSKSSKSKSEKKKSKSKRDESKNQEQQQQDQKNLHKKFAVGAYVHMLNEEVRPPSAEEKSKKNKKKSKSSQQLAPASSLSNLKQHHASNDAKSSSAATGTTQSLVAPKNTHKYFNDDEEDESHNHIDCNDYIYYDQQHHNKSHKNADNTTTLTSSSTSDDSDELSDEQVIDSYYEAINKSLQHKQQQDVEEKARKAAKQQQQQQKQQEKSSGNKNGKKKMAKSVSAAAVITNVNQHELDKIASNVVSTGSKKFKNNKGKQNGPKHIVFSATSASSSLTETSTSESSSNSSSSESSSNESEIQPKQQQENKKQQQKQLEKKQSKKEKQQQQQSKKNKNTQQQEQQQQQSESDVSSDSTSNKKKSSKRRSGKNKENNKENNKKDESKKQQQQQQLQQQGSAAGSKRYYEPSKEEQLKAVNTNRTFVIKNPQNLAEFKKVFQQTKANVPNADVYFHADGTEHKIVDKKQLKKQQQQLQKQLKQQQQQLQQQQQQQQKKKLVVDHLNDKSELSITELNSTKLTTSTSAESFNGSSVFSSTTLTSSSGSSDSDAAKGGDKKRRRQRKRSPRSPRYDFESLEKLSGQPRVNDRIAFRILEISSNFTPEISSFKTGTVIAFDSYSSEVTIKLSSRHHSILNKPSKFSVVLDKEEFTGDSDDYEADLQSHESNTLKINYKNLIDVRVLPQLVKESKKQQQQQHHNHHHHHHHHHHQDRHQELPRMISVQDLEKQLLN